MAEASLPTFFADLHLHSRFSRATSRELTLPALHAAAQRKGLALLGTGDVTHPGWFEELASQLEPTGGGLFRLRPDLARAAEAEVPAALRADVRFALQGEVSSIYRHDGRVRKVHNLVYLDGLDGARRLIAALDRLGNIRSDGRPILGLPSRDLLEIVLDAGGLLIPAHVWTPWFSVFGSKSGYDSLEQCFGDLAPELFALETGLSSDPAMNWRVSALDRYALVSNSDAHSPANLGREASEFRVEPSFEALFGSLRRPGHPGFLGTLEFFPEEGKYHLDGHRACGARLWPAEAEAAGRTCRCGAALTLGVLHRVEDLADRPEGERPPGARPFRRLVPLAEVLGESLGVGPQAKRVREVQTLLLTRVGPELFVLRDAPLEEIARAAGPVAAEGVRRVRAGELRIEAGYDGEFGTVHLFRPDERSSLAGQARLFAPAPSRVPAPVPPAPFTSRPAGCLENGPAPSTAAALDPDQEAAALAPAAPLLVRAGPGSGKTRVLAARLARKVLSGETAPERVLALTFTNRAAGELRDRLASALGAALSSRLTVCTLHRLGLDILKAEHGPAGLPARFALFGEEECLALLLGTGLPRREARKALEALSRARRCSSEAPHLESYVAGLRAAGAVDLDGLVLEAVRVLEADAGVRARWQARYDHVAVDEFQDLDPAQFRLLELLAPGPADLTGIGDPDQSIYGFRGADPGLFEGFRAGRVGAVEVTLGRNYRSERAIVAAASALLGRAPPAVCAPGAGRLVAVETADDRLEAEFVAREVERLVGGTSHRGVRSGGTEETLAFGDVAVLYRSRAQRRLLAEALGRAGIPCSVAGEEDALRRGRGRRVLRSLRRLAPEADALASVRSALAEARVDAGEPLGVAWLAAAAGAARVDEILEAVLLRAAGDDYRPTAERVALLTLHAAKGLEFDAVFVVGCEEGLLPWLGDAEDPADDEERRLFYVGLTRARRRLYLTRARRRLLHGRVRTQEPSRFLTAEVLAGAELRRLDAPNSARGRQLSLF